jgi:hypothetical protein
VALVEGFGVGWHQLNRYRDAMVLGDQALAIAESSNPAAWPRLVATLAMSRLLAGDAAFVMSTVPDAAARAEEAGDPWAEGWCHLVIGNRPPFDPAELLGAYDLGTAAGSPMLSALAAASVAFGGTENANDEWLRRARRHGRGNPNTSLKATRDLAQTDDWTERGEFAKAQELALAIALDGRQMPGLRLVAIGHVVQIALWRCDLELAERSMEVRHDVARAWPVGGWRFFDVDDLRVDWIRGDLPVLDETNSLHWTTRMGITPGPIRAACRATLDRGEEPDIAAHARTTRRPSPHSLLGSTIASVEAAQATMTGDHERARRRWSDALSSALAGGYVLLGCDALEGLAYVDSQRDEHDTARVLLTAARACRDKIGYRFRFSFEQHALDRAWATIGSETEVEPPLDWRDASELALSIDA